MNKVNLYKKNIVRHIWKHKGLLLLFFLSFAFYIVFCYLPMYGIIIAFKDYRISLGMFGSPWVGLRYFEKLFTHYDFYRLMRNTLLLNVYSMIFGFPAPIILALILNEVKNKRFNRSVQTAICLPHFVSWVIVAGLTINLLSPNGGVVNFIMGYFGVDPIYFMIREEYFRSIVVISGMWKDVGWGTLLFTSALAGIDLQLYEAAIVDGAGRWRQLWHISIPGIMPTVVIVLILSMGGMLSTNFDQVFNLLNPMTFEVGDVLDTYIYRVGLRGFEYSYTTAIGLFKSVIGMVLVLTSNYLAKKSNDYGMW